jgi:hypothetical protein
LLARGLHPSHELHQPGALSPAPRQEELEAAAADPSLAAMLVAEKGLGGDLRVLAEAVEWEREAVEAVIERRRLGSW